MFETLTALPQDPILGLTAAFRGDPRPDKIDLGVGVYKLADGTTPIMQAVKQAEKLAGANETTKSYVPPSGYPGFGEVVTDLVFGRDHICVAQGRVKAIHTPGGCGALRLAGEVLVRRGATNIYVGAPTWANHIPLMNAAGLTVQQIAYYNRDKCEIDFERFVDQLTMLGAEDVVLLHGACHNPSGADFSSKQWDIISDLAEERGFLPFIDTAYHGFANGLEEDVDPIRKLAARLPEMLISYSCSKNFGLYRERTGGLFVIGKTSDSAAAVQSHVINAARGMYSMPPAHGGAIVTHILQSEELTAVWKNELSHMAADVRGKRSRLVDMAQKFDLGTSLQFIGDQHGMFSLLPLSPEQVQQLRDDHGLYMAGDGRINICGLTDTNMDVFCRAYKSVL